MGCSKCGESGHNTKTCTTSQPSIVVLDVDEVTIKKMDVLVNIFEDVAASLKKGQVEGTYQKAITCDLQEMGIRYTSEETVPITYKGINIAYERIDIALSGWLDIVIELKAVCAGIKADNIWQVLSYMRYKNYKYGVVVNFNQSPNKQLEWQWVILNDGIPYIYDRTDGSSVKITDFEYPLRARETSACKTDLDGPR